jgi:hypothetical protein
MMQSRFTRLLFIVSSLLAASTTLNFAEAREGYWQGDVSTEWNLAGNWFVVGAPGDGSFVPQSSSGFNVRAVIGTDSPSGALNTTLGNSPVLSAALPVAKATIGGVYLGLRERDFTLNPPPFVNPAPAAGALVGKLTISGGTLNNVSTADAAFGADGRIVVGADGRGFLTMTGGTLNGQQLVVGGENFTGDALGTSMVDLSGTALLAISNSAVAANGTAALDRRLKITGPNARLTTGGTVTFGSTSNFTAVITSAANAAGPAMIQSSAAVKMGGSLNVEFSGAGATGHALGNKWNLLTGTTGVANNFTNLGVGNEITPTGLAAPAPLGSAYYLRTVDGGLGKLVQVSYEGVLVLNVNRDTGELRVTNPLGGNIAIDSYQVTSNRGSMVASYAGLGSSTPGAGVWLMGNNSATGLFEIKEPDMTPPIDANDAYNLTAVPSVSLGTGFSRTGVAANVANFGNDGEDLIFSYSSPDGGVIRGQIVYEGTKFENNLVLRVNPNSGVASLKNDSLETLVFDGFDITSSDAALSIAGFTPITGGTGSWLTDANGTTGLSQVNFTGARTLSPGQEVSIGDISATNFLTDAAKNGLSMNFILAEGLVSSAPTTDYNGNGVVDAADYTIWRDNLGDTGATQAQGDGDGDGNITQADYDLWKSQFGLTGVAAPETTFRTGSVVFDATLGSGGGALAMAVPEPSAGLLLIAGVGSLLFTRRRKQCNEELEELNVDDSEQPVLGTGQVGVSTMSRRVVIVASVAIGIVTALIAGRPAAAATGGLPITNFDMELPGPANSKVLAFDNTGAPIPGVIPGWTFVGPGVSLWTDNVPGDSGTEGGGVPGNAMLLNTHDGKVYQTVPGHTLINPMVNQQYRVSFNAWEIFSTYTDPNAELANGFRLTSRLYSGAYPGTTLMTQNVLGGTGQDDSYYEFLIPRDSAVLTGKLGQSLGIEFDVTSVEYSINEDALNTIRDIDQSWAHIDNVVFELVGLIPGDLNGDGVVNTADASNLTPNLQRLTPFEAEGELTGDNVVNLNDFRALKTLIAAAGSGSGGLAGSGSAVPEPSSLALLLATFGIVGGALARSRRRGTCGRVLILAVVALGSSLVLTAESNAELLFYDPFEIGASPAAGEYAADAPLGGQNPVISYGTQPDLLTGPWVLATAANTSTHVLSKSTGLNYIGAPAEGGSIGTVADPVDFGIDNRIGRKFKAGSEWTDTTVGTFYIGWLQNFGTGDFMGFRSMEFWRDPNGEIGDSNLLGDLGYNQYYSPLGSVQTTPATARMAFQGQIIDGAPVFVEDGATHLLVMKFVLSDQADSDQIFVYLDPTSVNEPDLANLAITDTNVQLGVLGIGQFGGFADNMNTIDELRIATLFSEALPELPLPGDVDGDRDVDLDDYNIIITNLGLQVSSANFGDVAKADGSQGSDGRVTIADYRIWKDHYPTLPPGAGGGELAAGVPEPSSCLLIAIGLALAACRRFRSTARI